jgi:hypothetical protein
MARKTRSDAHPLDKFREDLDQWIYVENLGFKEVVAEIEKKHGLKVSVSAVWRWKQDRDEDRLIEKIARDARRSTDAVDAFAEANPELDKAFTNLLKQVAFNLVSAPEPDPQAIMMVVGHALKVRDQEADQRDAERKDREEERKNKELQLKERDMALKEDLYQVRTCELFLKWFKDARLREIAESTTLNNTEKIATIRKEYFSDVDALQASGTVQLPPR